MFVRHKYSSSITGFIKRRVRESSPLEWTSLVTCSRVGGPPRSTETWEQKQLQSHSTGSFNNLMSKVRYTYFTLQNEFVLNVFFMFSGVYDAEKGTAFTKSKTSCCLLGLRARAYQYQPIADLKSETDFQVRKKKTLILRVGSKLCIPHQIRRTVDRRYSGDCFCFPVPAMETCLVEADPVHHENPGSARLYLCNWEWNCQIAWRSSRTVRIALSAPPSG